MQQIGGKLDCQLLDSDKDAGLSDENYENSSSENEELLHDRTPRRRVGRDKS